MPVPLIYDLQIQIYITSAQGDRLNVSETVQLPASDFLELAKILAQFHDLAQELRKAKK